MATLTEISVHEVFNTIVSSIRESNSISSVTNIGTTYTIFTSDTKNLSLNDYVKIDSVENLKIISLTNDVSFTVISTTDLSSATTWYANEPYFLWGKEQVIANQLVQKDNSTTWKYQKYPLIALIYPVAKSVTTNELDSIFYSANCRVYILDLINYKADLNNYDNQYTNVIVSKLTYIKTALINAIRKSKYIQSDNFTYTENLRFNFGTPGTYGNQNLIFNDYLAGYELNLNLEFYKQYTC